MPIDTSFLKDDAIQLTLEKTSCNEEGKEVAFIFAICNLEGTKMGACVLRIEHTPNMYYIGNIGYRVDKEFQGHHYSKNACLLLLELAKKLDMGYVIITCNPENYASIKTIEYSGAKFVETAELPEDNEIRIKDGDTEVRVYRFDL